MREMPFELHQDEDGWPPYSVEWLWISDVESHFKVLSAPFFIKYLAAEDEISINKYNQDGYAEDWTLIKSSGNSVMWISDLGEGDLSDVLNELRLIGCNTAVLGELSHATIDIPYSVTKLQIDGILNDLEGKKYAIAFPCDRQAR